MAKPDSVSVPASFVPTMPDDRRRYPGVRSFEEPDRIRFFGRTHATDELLLRVLSVRLLLQFAPSGVGKTSLLNAGLFPKLRLHNCFPFIIRLNQDKESLTQAATRSLKDAATWSGLKEPVIPENAESLWALLAGIQLWSHDLLLLTPVLVFDQFEEVFTLRDESFRSGFALEVGKLLGRRAYHRSIGHSPEESAEESRAPDVKIIISLREEYLGKLEEFSASIPDLFHERLRLWPLTADEAKEAIMEPAKLEGDTWLSPPFEFEPACLDGLIDFIDGTSDKVKVIEPLTLQLVCQQAEENARTRVGPHEHPAKLRIDDFGGLAGLERLVQSYFTSELDKLDGSGTRKQAREMFEQGLLDPTGKRLMLEQGEIERDYGLDPATLNTLVDSRLLRREPRNESVFYEISHDRLTEAIARNRTPRLPGWVKPTLAAGVVFILFLVVVGALMVQAKDEADAARGQAEYALGVLLGEDLVSRLREGGLVDALQGVLDDADIVESSSVALALKLRHQGDILRERGTVTEAREKLTESLRVLDDVLAREGGDASGLLAARARTLKRLGYLLSDGGEVAKAELLYVEAVQVWDQVLKGTADPQDALDAADTRIELGILLQRMGRSGDAESAFSEALRIALTSLTVAYGRAQGGQPEVFFEQGRAMQVYADAVLSLANLWGATRPAAQAAYALAREALRLRPLSSLARTQVGVASATYGTAALGDSSSTLALELFSESRRHFEELTQFDPNNRRLQRERAAVQVVMSDGVATCAETPACRKTLSRGALEEAEIATLESIGSFRWLAGLDADNRSLQGDIAWGLRIQARLLGALGDPVKALSLLDDSVAILRKSIVDERDVESRLNVLYLFHDKASLLEQRGRRLEALAALDESLAEVGRLPQELSPVMVARFDTNNARIELLKKVDRSDEAHRHRGTNEDLLKLIGTPWSARNERALALNNEGIQLDSQAAKGTGAAAAAEFRRALEKYERAIREDPFESTYWQNLRDSYERIAGALAPEPAKLDGAKDPHADEREAALRGALAAAWMARVLSTEDNAADLWKTLYEARRGLAIFLRDQGRADEVLPLVAQGVLDAEEFARRQAGSTNALLLLADANVGLAMLRSESGNDGWEEALRKGLAYGDQLAKKDPTKAEHRKWVGDFRRVLGDFLREAPRDEAAVEEYKLAVQACREALVLAKAGEEHDDAQSCLDALATLGYK